MAVKSKRSTQPSLQSGLSAAGIPFSGRVAKWVFTYLEPRLKADPTLQVDMHTLFVIENVKLAKPDEDRLVLYLVEHQHIRAENIINPSFEDRKARLQDAVDNDSPDRDRITWLKMEVERLTLHVRALEFLAAKLCRKIGIPFYPEIEKTLQEFDRTAS